MELHVQSISTPRLLVSESEIHRMIYGEKTIFAKSLIHSS